MKLFNRESRLERAASIAAEKAATQVFDKLGSGVSLKDFSLQAPYARKLFNLNGDDEQVTDAYTQSASVYAAIKVKATNVAQVPFEIFPVGVEDADPIQSGPVYRLMNEPNPNFNKYQLWEAIVTYMDLRGHAPIAKSDETIGGVPAALMPLNPDDVKFRIVNNLWAGIEYRRDKGSGPEFIQREQLIFPKYFNPKHAVKGLAPLEAARLGIENDYQAVLYNREFFKKGSAPGTIYTSDEYLEDHQYDRLKQQLIESRAGKHHRDLVLDGGLKPMPHISQKDMEYLNLRRHSLEEVGRVFGVPKTKLMQDNDVNYATAKIFEVAFWQDTLVPLMRLIESSINQDLLGPLGYRGAFNVESVPVFSEQILDKAEAAQAFVLAGWNINDVNETLGLGFPEQDVTQNVVQPPPEPPEPEEVEERSAKALPKPITQDMALSSMRELKWNTVYNRVNPTMGRMAKAVRSYFKSVQQQLFNRLTKGSGANAVLKEIPPEPRTALEWVDDILSDRELRATVRPLMLEAAGLGFDSVDVDIQIAREARAQADERILASVANRVTVIGRVNETIRENVKESIRSAIREGIETGATEEAKARLVLDAVGHQMDVSEGRAKTIARTETFGAFSDGRDEVYQIAKPIALRWISARDDRVRDSHQDLDGTPVRYGEEFKPGLKRPHDPGADPSETINCRCITQAIFSEDELDG